MTQESNLASPLLTALTTLTGNLYLVVGGLFWGFVTGFLGLFFRRGLVFKRIGVIWGSTTLWSAGARFESEFDQDLSELGNCILMANHQSLYDIPALLATLPIETRFLAKDSLFRIPLFGWALRTGGFIPVDRSDRSKAAGTFREAFGGLEEGVSILLFPEETRSADGTLQEFKRGGILLALRSGLPVVPVGISGTFDLRRKESWLIRPARVKVHYGRALSSEELGLRDKKQFTSAVRQEVARLSGQEARAK
jgi:1-acyl-sn-glycerol-3-phosphate acyltransferase